MGHKLRPLTLWEKFKLVLFVANLPVIIIYVIVRRFLSGLLDLGSPKKADSDSEQLASPLLASIMYTLSSLLFKQVGIPGMKRLILAITSPKLRQVMSRGLRNSYKVYPVEGIASRSLLAPVGEKTTSVELVKKPASPVSQVRWIVEAANRGPDDPVLLYFHGGGYVLPLMTDQYQFCLELYQQLKNPRVSILFLDYNLSPEAQYPDQLIDAAAVYHQLVDIEGARNVSLIGDSCGGNLSIVLMAHIVHPHPDPRVVRISSKTRPTAAILISPWVDLEPIPVHPASSYVMNSGHDYLSTDQEDAFAVLYCPNIETRINDVYVSPLRAPADFWDGVFPPNTFTVWGDKEILRDDCREFCKIANLSNTFVEREGVHIGVIFDRNQPTMSRIVKTLQ